MAKAPAATKTYILELKNGDTRKITIPAHWKITYGNVVPYQGKGSHSGEHRVALRLYDGSKENLRAVMTDVAAIRDESIKVLERRTSVKRQAAQKKTSQGMKDIVIEARMTEWVNPDAEEDDPPQEFVSLPKAKEVDF